MADDFDPIYDRRHRPPDDPVDDFEQRMTPWERRWYLRELEAEEEALRLAEEWRAEQLSYEPMESPDFGPSYRDSYTPQTGYTPPPKETA